jgi:hypothetical protein
MLRQPIDKFTGFGPIEALVSGDVVRQIICLSVWSTREKVSRHERHEQQIWGQFEWASLHEENLNRSYDCHQFPTHFSESINSHSMIALYGSMGTRLVNTSHVTVEFLQNCCLRLGRCTRQLRICTASLLVPDSCMAEELSISLLHISHRRFSICQWCFFQRNLLLLNERTSGRRNLRPVWFNLCRFECHHRSPVNTINKCQRDAIK